MLKTEKVIQLRKSVGQRTLRVVREHYVREDIPCQSSLCLSDCAQFCPVDDARAQLPCDVTHYVVPDCQVARDFMEILEFPELSGIIFLQTVAQSVQHEGTRRLYKRLQNLVKDKRKSSVLFYNEFQKYCYCPRQQGESLVQWQTRSVYEGAGWYHNHFAGQMPIIVLTENKQTVSDYGHKVLGVFVMTVLDYLESFWPKLRAAHDLYESLSSALGETKNKGKDFSGYLPTEVLEAGVKSGRFRQGRLQVNKHNAQQEAFISPIGLGSKDEELEHDILIHGVAARNRAVHGDLVVVELLPRAQWKGKAVTIRQKEEAEEGTESGDEELSLAMPTGIVIGVLQRNWRDYVASFQQQEDSGGGRTSKVLVIPWDWRIPKIRIGTSQAEKLKDQRIIVRIDSWDVDSQYPNGHFVRTLGKMGDLETEIAAILVENGISVGTFSEGLMKEMPVNTQENPWKMCDEEISRRRDLRRSHLIFSIDPKGCEDVDDTLSVKKLENGNLELGVHIADVTYFVKPNSITDLEARSRSTTVYLADRRYDMLPGILSADLCSLLSGVDRYAMSVIWELDKQYEVVNVWYGRTVIRSAYKLFYEIAQQLCDGADKTTLIDNIPELQGLPEDEQDHSVCELRWSVSHLMNTARHLRARRNRGGALELEGVEVRVQLDDSKAIEDLVPKQPLEVHETIAECMIFANHWVAKKICEAFPNQALLRHHPLPRQEHFDLLICCASAKGFQIETHSNKALADSLDKCVDPNDQMINKLLRTLATQAMSNASYFSTGTLPRDQFFHYGLALDYYTHFTSPIRRYADIIFRLEVDVSLLTKLPFTQYLQICISIMWFMKVHRLLLAALETTEQSLLSNKELDELSQHINSKHRESQHAQRDSSELFQTLFFQDRKDDEHCIADAVIFQLRANGLLVFIPRYGIKGPVYLRSKEGQVIFITEDMQPQWTGGNLTKADNTITVNSNLGSCTYHIFDHITVKISTQASHAHLPSLRLDLISNHPHRIVEGLQAEALSQKTDIVKAVTEAAGENDGLSIETVALGAQFEQHKHEYGQSQEGKSLYSVFQSLQHMALLTE